MNFLAIPFYTHIFPPGEYGVLNFVTTLMGLLMAVLILGGDSAYARFFFEVKDDDERATLTSTWLGFLAVWASVVIVLCLPAAGLLSRISFDTTRYRALYLIALVTAPVALSNRMLAQVFRNRFQPGAFVVLNVGSSVVSVGLGLYLTVGAHMGLTGIFLGILVGEAAFLLPRAWAARRMLRLRLDYSKLRSLLAYGVPLVPVSLSYWVFLTADRLIVGKFAGFTTLGLYGLANSLTGVLMLVSGAIGRAWTPHAFRTYEEQPEQAPLFFARFLTHLLIVMGVLSVVLSTFAPEAVRLVSGAAYAKAASAVPPLGLALVAYASTQVTALGISLAKRTGLLARYSFYAAAANIGLCFILIPPFGLYGAAWASTAAYTLLTVLYMRRSQKLSPIRIERRKTAVVLVSVTAFSLVAPVLPSGGASDIAIKLAYVATFLGALVVAAPISFDSLRSSKRVVPSA